MAFAKSRAAAGFGMGIGIGVAIGLNSATMGRWLVFGLLLGILFAAIFSIQRG